MLADFTITINDARKPLAVRIIVHENLRALRSAATQHTNRWAGRRKKKQGEFQDTLGICHRFHLDSTDVCAIVRLAPPNIGVGIVAHELTHAAVWMWDIEHKFEEDVSITCANDEWFAWILGELMSKTVTKLYEHEIY